MEKSSTSSRFRFRDHQLLENSEQSSTSSDISSDPDDESELQSMTAKGIKHLCLELLELKAESDEDFHRNIFLNYAAFVRVFEEVEGVEDQLMQLKSQVNHQKRLVNNLIDDIYLKALSKESIESIIEESVIAEPSVPSELEAHIGDLSEAMGILLAENRIDEAMNILEMEDENFQRLQYDDNYDESDVLLLYDSAISEKRDMLMLQLTLMAENPRISAPELQKTLVQVCRLGDSHLATQLLLKYYHSRIATGIHNLQGSKSYLHGVYIRELAKFVFSMISQAARSFAMLYGETSPYASELIQWACEETEVFVAYFNKYVKPISEMSGGLSTAVEAVQFAMSICTLLESHRLVLRPCLIKEIRPCMEEVVQIHIDHFKKVIVIFTATDAWVLGRYIVSRILNEEGSSVVVGQQPEYCLLTNSGRKFITLLQTITADVIPLVSLQMEGSILRGLMDLFTEYIGILEKVITCETSDSEKGGARINLAESLPQQVSVLANLSTLQHFFSGTVRSIFRDINELVGFQQRELNSCLKFIQAASDQLRFHFCQKSLYRMMSLQSGLGSIPEACTDNAVNHDMLPDVMPSHVFQVLFLELRALNKLAEDNAFELDWFNELLRELIEAIFDWISSNKQIWAPIEKNLTGQNSYVFNQFVFDIHFLVEIAKHGGYFSNNPSVLVDLMNSAFISAGLDPRRDVNDDGWIKNSAEAIQRLMEIRELKSLDDGTGEKQDDDSVDLGDENQINYVTDSFQDDDRGSSEDSEVSTDASEVASDTK
ncbi:exocyst complex component EXO84B-like [Pistacia vera]|uniref:exocyst complex component EXO84B-like n=1 Tax=Pistacia vera TaxID=55513 RepID=UPI001263860F|nr:exocyst complex component EXO84B-like [Pistacia vera]